MVYTELFKDGVMVVKERKKNSLVEKNELKSIIIIKLLKGLLSKGYVSEKYLWKVYYFTLNEKGAEYLRYFLNLPPTVVPLTFKNSSRSSRN